MDANTARDMLAFSQKELARNEAEHKVLVGLVRSLEGCLRVYGETPLPAKDTPLPPLDRRPSVARAPTEVKLSHAVLEVIRDAGGAPLRSEEILSRVRQRGADTRAKDPIGIVDLVAGALRTKQSKPIEKVGPRTWRWTGDPDGTKPGKTRREPVASKRA